MIISLLYHDVVAPGEFYTSGFRGRDADIYKLPRPQFGQHLEAIMKLPQRLEVELLDSAASNTGTNALLFTVDDGGASALSAAALLEPPGRRAQCCIIS